MAVLSLPVTFNNSFWSQDYRRGLEVLFEKLEQGVHENEEIVTFIRNRAQAEASLANVLINPAVIGRDGKGFAADEGASLFVTFRGLQAESVAQGQLHKNIASELNSLVADPFDKWAQGYKGRLRQQRSAVIDNWLRAYEHGLADVAKLKQQYLEKTRRADEAVDDAKFAPNSNISDTYTSSPRLRPIDSKRTPPQRTPSVSERIAQRFKDIQKNVIIGSTVPEEPASPTSTDEKPIPKVDKGKGKMVEEPSPIELSSPIPLTPQSHPSTATKEDHPIIQEPPILLAGLSFTPAAVSQLLSRAASELPLRNVRFPVIGEYNDSFTGDEFVAWLNANVPGFGGNLDLAEDAARDLTEGEGLLRRLGELGNQFEHSDDAWYQFRPKAFTLGDSQQPGATKGENLLKRSATIVNMVSKALNANSSLEPAYIRAYQEATEADKTYRIAVRRLDRQRLGLEERIEETLRFLQKWEAERLAAVKTVLLQYQGTLDNLPKALQSTLERSSTLVAAFQPDSDLIALVERYRTGPFRPSPQLYESVSHDESDVVFGIDLRKWAEGGWFAMQNGEEKKETVPPVFTALMNGIEEGYGRLNSDIEKRKAWIYEVPLPGVHLLRETLNAVPPDQPFQPDLFARVDPPVIASAIKLWLLELNPPIGLYENWDEFRKIYPNVGSASAKPDGEITEEQRLQNISAALQRLPRVHLYVLDAVVKHLNDLIASTKVEESDEIFINKLALSLGRNILRPKVESEISIQDRHPTLLFMDLLKNYDALLPPTIERKKRESERKVPVRKRTAPIDMRLSRSRISIDASTNPQALLAAQKVAQNPTFANSRLASPPLPPPPSAAEKLVASPPPPPPASARTALVPPPPPPASVVERLKAPPPPPPPNTLPAVPPPPLVSTQPPRQFKEPPAEQDDLPPRPNFKEPPPELDDLPPRPKFKEPPPESESNDSSSSSEESSSESESQSAGTPAIPSPPATAVIPPTPAKGVSAGSGSGSPSSTKRSFASRSPSPPAEDVTIAVGKSTLTRHGSGESARSGIRVPRITRGPRGPSGGSVSSLVQTINRASLSSSPTPAAQAKANNRLSAGGSPVRRPSSIVGRSSAGFQRRTMASDAEDEVVDRS